MADTSYVDDPSIADKAPLWRRIPPWHFVYDDNLGRVRPSRAAFENHPDGTPMSVALGEDVLNAGRTAESVIAGNESFGLVSFPAGLARAKDQGVMRKPTAEEPAHAEVFGKKTGSVKKAIAKECEWVVAPPAPT